MLDEKFEQIFDQTFQTPDLATMWPELSGWYKGLGFTDPISDADRIEEFSWIMTQIRKYIGKKHDVLYEAKNKGPMYLEAEIEDSIAKAKETAEDRKHLVYNMIRDEWLINLLNLVREQSADDREAGKDVEDELWI